MLWLTAAKHGEKMKELLLRLFNLEDPETAAPRTADRSSLDIGQECTMNGVIATFIQMM